MDAKALETLSEAFLEYLMKRATASRPRAVTRLAVTNGRMTFFS